MKGEDFRLASEDGFALSAYHVEAEGERRGGLVLIQEIFGVNENIRALADSFAADGFEVVAPSLYDRVQPGFRAGYDPDGIQAGLQVAKAVSWETVVPDLQAAIDHLEPPVFTAGYCWGGSATWIAACRNHGLTAASSFYGRLITQHLDETPRCPIILHFGEHDHTIPLSEVDKITDAHPRLRVFTYDAGHGFFSDRRSDYSAEASALARRRTLKFFEKWNVAPD